MTLSSRVAAASLVLAAVGLTASDECAAQEVVAYAEGRPVIDYDAFWAAVPQIKELAKEALDLARQLNESMDALASSENDAVKSREARVSARDLLDRYSANRVKLIAILDACLKTPPAKDADVDILKRLRETELIGIKWDKTKFIDCLRDLAGAMNLRFVMHPDVLKFNTVEAAFPRSSADGILRAITSGFDCDYIIRNGEIVVIKSIKRNDKRLQQYLDRHPEWKYWRAAEVKEVEDDL